MGKKLPHLQKLHSTSDSDSLGGGCGFLLFIVLLIVFFYIGGWSVEGLDRLYQYDLSVSKGYIGITFNDSTYWGITPSSRFFRFGWVSWACLVGPFILGCCITEAFSSDDK